MGFVAAVPVINDYTRTRHVYHIPLAILASALEIVAVMMAGIGLVLDPIAHQQRMDYERSLLVGAGSGGDYKSSAGSTARFSLPAANPSKDEVATSIMR
jgi:hypothetical protein